MTTAREARASLGARIKRREQRKRHVVKRFAEAKESHRALVFALGGRCALCLDPGINAPLTVDHVDGITWDRRAYRYDARIKRYWAEYAKGVRLRCLCKPCNDNYRPGVSEEEVPF